MPAWSSGISVKQRTALSTRARMRIGFADIPINSNWLALETVPDELNALRLSVA